MNRARYHTIRISWHESRAFPVVYLFSVPVGRGLPGEADKAGSGMGFVSFDGDCCQAADQICGYILAFAIDQKILLWAFGSCRIYIIDHFSVQQRFTEFIQLCVEGYIEIDQGDRVCGDAYAICHKTDVFDLRHHQF